MISMITRTLSDIDLWKLIREGDRSSFDSLYHRHVAPLFAMVYKHIRVRADAEDIIQEVFLELWEKRKEIEIQRSLFNYLYSMARYKTLRYIKANNARPESLDLFKELSEEMAASTNLPEAATGAVLRTLEAALSSEVERMPEQMKKIYQLKHSSGMSVREIADQLFLSSSTVKNHLASARKRLRESLSRLGSWLFTFLF